jgi:hypothetical protein
LRRRSTPDRPTPPDAGGSTAASLEPLDGIRHHHTYGGKAQHGKGVFAPVHFTVGVDAGQPINEPLDRPENGIEPGALAFENPRQVEAHRARDSQQDQAEKSKLEPAIG